MSKSIVEIEGFKELERKIKKLGNDKDKKREMILILKNEAKATVESAKRKVRVRKGGAFSNIKTKKTITPGTLKESIGTIIGRKGKSRINPTVYAGPRVKGKWDGYYGAWLEKGHNIYKKGFKRNRVGKYKYNDRNAKKKTQAYPYMEPAYKETKGRVTKDLEKATAKFIQRRINKLSS